VTIAVILHFSLGIAMLIVGLGTLLGQILRRQPPDQTIFNGSQTMLQAAAGGGMLAVVRGDVALPLSGTPLQVLIIVAVGAIVSVVNLLAVATVIGFQTRVPVARVVTTTIRSLSLTDYLAQAVQVSIGVVAAALAATAPWTVGLLLAPSAAVYRVLRHNSQLRHRLAVALRDREMTLNEAERVAGLGSWEWHIRDDEQRWSSELYRLLGVHPDAGTHTIQTFVQRVHPADRVTLSTAIHQAVHAGASFCLEHRILGAAGTERIVETHGSVICDEAGQPVRIVGTVHDITDRKALQARLLDQVTHSPLTAREVELLGYLARGNANKEIAVHLGISEQTVKNHVSSILRKLRVNDRTQAAVYAMRRGWIQLDEARSNDAAPVDGPTE
jgi:DNA-binding NarL/FixJ family response regulator